MSPVVAANLLQSREFLLTVGLLAVVLAAGAVVLYATDRWRRHQADDRDDSPMTLSHYRDLYEAGELTEAEYVKVRDRMASKMRAKPAATPADPPRPTDPPAE